MVHMTELYVGTEKFKEDKHDMRNPVLNNQRSSSRFGRSFLTKATPSCSDFTAIRQFSGRLNLRFPTLSSSKDTMSHCSGRSLIT